MNLVAKTIDGMKHNSDITVTGISVWIDRTCNHNVNNESLAGLLASANATKRMQVYPDGKIDAFDSTPLYIYGQRTVIELLKDGISIWKKY